MRLTNLDISLWLVETSVGRFQKLAHMYKLGFIFFSLNEAVFFVLGSGEDDEKGSSAA